MVLTALSASWRRVLSWLISGCAAAPVDPLPQGDTLRLWNLGISGSELREQEVIKQALAHEEQFGQPDDAPLVASPPREQLKVNHTLKDGTKVFDCIELFSGQGGWSSCHRQCGLRVHPGIERTAKGRGYGDLSNNQTFRDLATLAYNGAIGEWHAAPPCWSFGTLRRPRLRSKSEPAGFDLDDALTKEQTLLAVRTAFLLTLALQAGAYVS